MFATSQQDRYVMTWAALCCLIVFSTGCASTASHKQMSQTRASLPKEMTKVSQPEYQIGFGDILTVEVTRMVPKPPYHLQASDSVVILGFGLEDEDFAIDGSYRIQPGGRVILPPPIGVVTMTGMTAEEASEMLARKVREAIGLEDQYASMIGVSVNVQTISGIQPIADTHTVGMDGRINLGVYGGVHVVGLTLLEAREAIEFQLSSYLDLPQVAVDIFSYNSVSYYVIMEGAGFGDKLISFPYTGNETVLDAIAGINGMERVSSKRIWIARPSPLCDQDDILPVDWRGITAEASYCTNYQLMPGDRIFIEEDKLVAFDTKLSKIIAPMERVMGFALLGAQTATRFSGSVLKGGGNPTSGGN